MQPFGDAVTAAERDMVNRIWVYSAKLVCAGCKKEQIQQSEHGAVKFGICSICKMKHYCSPERQKKDWPVHKTMCRKQLKKGDLVRVHHLENPDLAPKFNGSILQVVKDLTEEEEKAEQDPRVCVTVIGSTPDTPVMKFRKSKLNSHVWRRKNVK